MVVWMVVSQHTVVLMVVLAVVWMVVRMVVLMVVLMVVVWMVVLMVQLARGAVAADEDDARTAAAAGAGGGRTARRRGPGACSEVWDRYLGGSAIPHRRCAAWADGAAAAARAAAAELDGEGHAAAGASSSSARSCPPTLCVCGGRAVVGAADARAGAVAAWHRDAAALRGDAEEGGLR
eukprot:gene53506-61344_t